MLGRRQLRAKAMQAIYGYYRGGTDLRNAEKQMVKGIDEIFDLYIYELNLIKILKEAAQQKIEIGLAKNFPSEDEANPSYKFVNNAVLRILEVNKTLESHTASHNELQWSLLDNFPVKLMKDLAEDDRFVKYLRNPNQSFSLDKEIIVYIFENYIADSDEFAEFLEEKNLHWADDLHIANTMTLNTLNSFTKICNEHTQLYKLLQDEAHLDFTIDLLRKTITHEKELIAIIDEKASNWELERIALIDRILLQMALAEFLYFPSIPPKVTINEYVEIAKFYSTPHSNIFINGILDKTLKEYKEQKKINKTGRGLL